MLNAKNLSKMISMLLAICMLFTFAGCGKAVSDTSSDEQINYGDEDYEIDDGDDTVVVDKENKTTKRNNAASYNNSNTKHTFTIDETKKESFLESVPKNLSGQEVSILVWWNPFDYEKKKWERFTAATGIKIKPIYVTGDAYLQRLASLKAAGNSPDIAAITSGTYPSAIMQNYFQPLSAGIKNYDPAVYDVDSMNLLKWNGVQYGAIIKGTTYITMGLMVFNADVFKKYGVKDPNALWQEGNWNWDTFVSTASEIQKKSNLVGLTADYQGFRLVQTCGEDAVTIKNGKISNNTSSKTYRDAYKWVNDLQMIGQYKVADFSLNLAGFKAGKSAMYVGENWSLQKGERFENTSFTLGYAPLPSPKGKQITIPSDAQLWGFPVGAKHTTAAGYVLEYWQNPAFNEVGNEIWLNDSVAAFCDWMWSQPKSFKISQGIINYGGDYEWGTYAYECASAGKDKLDSTMDKWSGVIDSNIKKISKEFG